MIIFLAYLIVIYSPVYAINKDGSGGLVRDWIATPMPKFGVLDLN